MPISILTVTGAIYLISFFLHLWAFLNLNERVNQWALLLVRVGFLIHTFYFFSESKTEGLLIPVSTFGQVMAFFSWSLAFVYLVLLTKVQRESFGLILSPILALIVGTAILRYQAGPISLPKPLNPYFILHLVTVFFAYASFTLSFVAAILYLIQHHELKRKRGGTFYQRLPSLEDLEGLIFQPMAWGVFLLFLAIAIGFLWAKSALGTYLLREPKTLFTIAIAVFYLVLVYTYYGAASRGKRLVMLSLIAFIFVFLNFFGTHFSGKGVHYLQVKPTSNDASVSGLRNQP
ncbi:MAG: cytochrome c biogenesis protein CcsA [Candidatus Omnitrophica bacterium]|nr:cytochrome c biogenesis protein CcsA [Candidatus Omnitrophota bacterium]